jgi:hypothetical protein
MRVRAAMVAAVRGPGGEAPEGVRAVAGEFRLVCDLLDGGLDPVCAIRR